MYALVSYDVVKHRRRDRLHKFLLRFGLNTQRSVFECELDAAGLRQIRRYAEQNLDPAQDSLRIYGLCRRCYGKVEISGQGFGLDTLDYLVV